jgi:glycosyltransferase involved in cell wall biosynthesis
MKQLLDLYHESQDPQFIDSQFNEVHENKNVLFVNPQLNGRNFYRYILPYIVMYEVGAWGTATTPLDKYKPNKEYELIEVGLTSRQILWADFIVFPFVNQPLADLYKQVRLINPDISIVFNIDFNYYVLSKNHPLHETFSTPESIDIIEDNVFYSDLTLLTNPQLSEFMLNKFSNELMKEKYKDQESNLQIGVFPMFIDEEVIFENMEEELPEISEEEKETVRVGIVATNYTWEDLNSYKEQLKEAQKKLGKKVKFFLIGFDGVDEKTGKSCLPKDFEFEHIKPCSMIHYFKQLRDLQLDLMFIPLRKNEFNTTSENYNKFLEAGIFKVPVMVYDIYPYNEVVKNGQTGIIILKKKEFVERLEHFATNKDELKRMGLTAYNMIKDNFTYHNDNLPLIDHVYSDASNTGNNE